MKSIIFYETENGKIPVKDFFDSLDDPVFQKIVWVLNLITELDRVPGNYFKKLVSTEDLWECRVIFQGNIYRILCFFHHKNMVILTHGFQKKTQKTPKKEIELATKYKNDYLRRHQNGS